MPEPRAIPFSSSMAKPNGKSSASRIASNARPAVFCMGSSGKLRTQPRMASMRTTASSMRRTVV